MEENKTEVTKPSLSTNGKTPANDVELVKYLNTKYRELKSEVAKVIVGQDAIIDQIIIAILARGHCLLVGVPGLAKTLLVKTLADVLELKFSRIQFTPDLMPSDIVGTEILEDNRSTGSKNFKFIHGPVFANMVLADEINRTPPKTQSALLEAMQEHKVTAAGTTYTLDEPFFVLATQNPIEHEGTYPLPEAQLDRFMFNIWLDYPSITEEMDIIKYTTSMYSPKLNIVLKKDEITMLQELVKRVPVADNVIEYTVNLVNRTRPAGANTQKYIKDWLEWGAGPRASQYLILGAKTNAILSGRYSPEIEDVKTVAKPVLRHRLITNFNAEADGIKTTDIIEKLISE
ncbi:MAG TPA: AAA family ATPase [Ignavibacteria bacterium]|nr:AAA family ATPase [Ignavibacteria bacterium]HAX50000.1 AAA family ATPase [Bacteroidota bacterium]HRE10813.1 AAA family ATPase [Ignavibacteria bacterium]HRF65944.1 AAA family ATPase [Ignavibacteria bacterium]HRJ02786.1 AAA family ATPase [Ignavibacteria bacterium]